MARQLSMSAVDRRSHEGDPWARGDRPAASRRGSVTLNLIRATLVGAAVGLAGCGSLPRNAVPVELMSQATVADMPEVRAAGGRPSAVMGSDLARSFEQESAAEFPVGPDGLVHYAHLALSGGGANGAFGAGLLVGWTKSGKRPPFKIVTGVSTGALMAPFAFLGSEHDDALTEFCTTTSSLDIFRMLSMIPQLLGGESLADTGPLRQMIEQQVDAELLRRMAEEPDRGRRLYIATVDLDSQRVWIWNMGMIARAAGRAPGTCSARSCWLPHRSRSRFPPVFIDVEADDQRFDEMHVDGGVGTRVFFSGGVFSFTAARAGRARHGARGALHHPRRAAAPAPDTTTRSLRASRCAR